MESHRSRSFPRGTTSPESLALKACRMIGLCRPPPHNTQHLGSCDRSLTARTTAAAVKAMEADHIDMEAI
ncbi:hypothetical protein [Rhodoligotrophos ferricapiens]|uniref:hypothetical protein n=1 Tax=Rhodoligotrophos ferricapiens TaxID=3069264 RepID=UPI00315D681D